MQILVTGGAGFIGGHLAESFVADGHDVVVFDSFDAYYHRGIKDHTVERCRAVAAESEGSYTLRRGDIREREDVRAAFDAAAPDVVYHQAAQAGVRISVEQPTHPNAVNVGGTLTVLDAARETGVDRVVIASSSSVYGKTHYLPYDEDHPQEPVSPYGVTKLAGDHYARVYDDLYDLSTVCLRYFTVYGPRMRPNMAISNFTSRCLNDEPPVIYGNGAQTRDFTYVDDVVAANRTLLTSDAADGMVLNVGSGDTIDITELAETVRDLVNPDLGIEHRERIAGDAEHTQADVSRARDVIGYEPTTPIREGVERFVEWYRANREWYEPLVVASREGGS
ncbi:GDP-mannose 4,6-dehydratase [Halocalculus aciditolerans]|uniref:UDP-glucose 4-epimerase n=1 Tax=Halocalculus aciditolerans TaxID=1383812 RepID=A0A830FIH1_9EURY|nr:GDP-mannose 4,6-dehydratase [Halocalculus aciditolerans]GGL55940.1 UDP-glucose 4-epimerase [Halocalculus aciditolerans]